VEQPQLVTLLLALVGIGAGRALASDPVALCLVDKVVFEPNERIPNGFKSGARLPSPKVRLHLQNAERGYLYYKANSEKPTACRNEWTDLKTVAALARSSPSQPLRRKGKLRKKETKAENPDVYPVAMGLTKVKELDDYEPLKQLAKLRDAAHEIQAARSPEES